MKVVRSRHGETKTAEMTTDVDPYDDKGLKDSYDKPGVSVRLVAFMGGESG